MKADTHWAPQCVVTWVKKNTELPCCRQIPVRHAADRYGGNCIKPLQYPQAPHEARHPSPLSSRASATPHLLLPPTPIPSRVARLLRTEYAKYCEILCQICQLNMKICQISGYNMPNSGTFSAWTSMSISLQTNIAKTFRQRLYIYFIRPQLSRESTEMHWTGQR